MKRNSNKNNKSNRGKHSEAKGKNAPILDDKILYQMTIEDLTDDGDGVGRIEGITVFVHNALPGDEILTKLIKVKKNYAIGIIHQMLQKSPNRINEPCPYARQCGGCQLQAYDYKAQTAFKSNYLLETLARIGDVKDFTYDGFVNMEAPTHYRNKGIYQIAPTKNGPAIGFYRKRSHDIIDVKHCMLQTEATNDLIYLLKGWILKSDISLYNENTREGTLRRVMVRDTQNGDAMMLVLVVTQKDAKLKKLIKLMMAELPVTLKSVYLNINDDFGNTALSYNYEHVFGDEVIIDTIGEAKFKISPQSFFQINKVQTEALYDVVAKYTEGIIEASSESSESLRVSDETSEEESEPSRFTNSSKLSKKLNVLDLYCGLGSIGIYLTQKLKRDMQIIGVEIIESAILDARLNADFNGLENTTYHVGKAESIMPELKEEGNHPDIIILDPPRKGCDQSLLETLVDMDVKNIVYVSCKPSTLARDLKFLQANGYKVENVTGVDMFPWTGHVETIVALYKKD